MIPPASENTSATVRKGTAVLRIAPTGPMLLSNSGHLLSQRGNHNGIEEDLAEQSRSRENDEHRSHRRSEDGNNQNNDGQPFVGIQAGKEITPPVRATRTCRRSNPSINETSVCKLETSAKLLRLPISPTTSWCYWR